MNLTAISIGVTLLLGIAGYVATYLNNLALARRKERLELVTKQINDFYGPLYLASKASEIAYQAFKQTIGVAPQQGFATPQNDSPTMKEWRLWVTEVFMPMNQSQEKIILSNAHLILEQEVPDCLLKFVAHIAAWKALLKKWEEGDHAQQFAIVEYPADVVDYAAKAYAALKAEQLALIGRAR